MRNVRVYVFEDILKNGKNVLISVSLAAAAATAVVVIVASAATAVVAVAAASPYDNEKDDDPARVVVSTVKSAHSKVLL